MDDKKFVLGFSKINIKDIANELQICRCGIYNGNINKKYYSFIKDAIITKICKLYLESRN